MKSPYTGFFFALNKMNVVFFITVYLTLNKVQ